MNELHPLYFHNAQNESHVVSPEDQQQAILGARNQTIEAVDEIRRQLKLGMTEREAHALALEVFRSRGVSKHWHRPYVRFGSGTTLSFNDPIREQGVLTEGDPYYLDLGPVWQDASTGLEFEGDYGDSFVWGENPEAQACIDTCHQIFLECQKQWLRDRATGAEMYRLIQDQAARAGYTVHPGVLGHRVGHFPHARYSKTRLQEVSDRPTAGIWVLEVQILHPQKKFGAFFEDVVVESGVI